MVYRSLADLVVIVHVAFILFVAVGGLLAWRWPRVFWAHLPAALYAGAIVTIGFDCPLTPLEKHLRDLGGENDYSGGFVNHYLKDVVYPGGLTPFLRALAALAIAVGYIGLYLKWRRARPAQQPVLSTPTNARSCPRS